MIRFTIADAEAACERLCRMTGHVYRPRRSRYDDIKPGDWYLEKDGMGNYVRVVERTERGGEAQPMGGMYYSYKEFVDAVSFFANALSNCYVVRGTGARGYPAGVFEFVPEGTDLEAHAVEAATQGWRVVRPLKVEQPVYA